MERAAVADVDAFRSRLVWLHLFLLFYILLHGVGVCLSTYLLLLVQSDSRFTQTQIGERHAHFCMDKYMRRDIARASCTVFRLKCLLLLVLRPHTSTHALAYTSKTHKCIHLIR
jgi:hypothetical protein